MPARIADQGRACNPSARAGSASCHEAPAVPQSCVAESGETCPPREVFVSPSFTVPPSTGSELAKVWHVPRDSPLGAPNTLAPSMGSGRAEATPPACGPSPGASLGPDAELSWAIEIGSRYSSLSKELIRAGVPIIMMDHFTSQKGLTGPAIRLDLRSSRGWALAYELLASGGLAYIHFEPPRGTLAPHSRERVRWRRNQNRESERPAGLTVFRQSKGTSRQGSLMPTPYSPGFTSSRGSATRRE